jgi:hypothetical protein
MLCPAEARYLPDSVALVASDRNNCKGKYQIDVPIVSQ